MTLGEHLAVSDNDPAPTTTTVPSGETEEPTTTTIDTDTTTSTVPDLTALPATGRSLNTLPSVLLLATGSIGVFASRRKRAG